MRTVNNFDCETFWTYLVKFMYSEKATKFCEIFTLLSSHVVPVKSKVKISQNFVASSDYTDFRTLNVEQESCSHGYF